ncbi:heterokaryon incompatibility protein-domain-containing protein [Staphylotrichum tortipilum]|uniref:Heterokaryon incompatibility protein-domain-containing protein n=1 Tax=Staphylotrichum tortipilum TaxID=2831512 RepID=A0AAN6RP34_9PEZI|nr:heterokaryon incompatibility protein-domain-containing protein [Staphylotrichum longicolle]
MSPGYSAGQAGQAEQAEQAGQAGQPTSASKIDSTVAYQGSKLGKDSIRLLEIESAQYENSPLVCTLRKASFGSRPTYEALSYCWGTNRETDLITLNGFPFEVRKNVLDGLRFLRERNVPGAAPRAYWIDALCINQDDLAEKTQQIRMMDQIYFRASAVLVWLGAGRYTELQQEIAQLQMESLQGNASSPITSREIEMASLLRTDPYWGRLWILQEMSVAGQLTVCFGDQSLSWASFMALISQSSMITRSAPQKLDKLLRKKKYHGTHTLRCLLTDHQHAECSNPRDRVYALAGIARNGAGFPIDYRRSLYELWKDTMEFLARTEQATDGAEALAFGARLKRLLMADADHTVEASRSPGPVNLSQFLIKPPMFRLQAVPVGRVKRLGPYADEVIDSPTAGSEWCSVLAKVFKGTSQSGARREYDELLGMLLSSANGEVKARCFSRSGTATWRGSSSRPPSSEARHLVRGLAASGQPRLYLAKSGTGHTIRSVGVAAGGIQVGDLVCWVREAKRAFLVRLAGKVEQRSAQARLFGAVLADMVGFTKEVDSRDNRWEYMRDWDNRLEVDVDAGTMFLLLD